MAEIDVTYGNKKGYAEVSRQYYEKAYKQSEIFKNDHPTKLGVILNYAVFLYEVMHEPQKAMRILAKGFNDYIDYQDTVLVEYNYKDSGVIVQLMHDNAMQWMGEYTKDNVMDLVHGYVKEIKKQYDDMVIPEDIIPVLIEFYFVDLRAIWKEVAGFYPQV